GLDAPGDPQPDGKLQHDVGENTKLHTAHGRPPPSPRQFRRYCPARPGGPRSIVIGDSPALLSRHTCVPVSKFISYKYSSNHDDRSSAVRTRRHRGVRVPANFLHRIVAALTAFAVAVAPLSKQASAVVKLTRA